MPDSSTPHDTTPHDTHVKPQASDSRASTSVESTPSQSTFQAGGKGKQQQQHLKQTSENAERQAHPDLPAAQHRTGSFTGTAEEPEDPSK
jgi:hypothetical protein